VTVNAELQAKIEQLAGMQNDMRNLLDSVNVGTVFLDTSSPSAGSRARRPRSFASSRPTWGARSSTSDGSRGRRSHLRRAGRPRLPPALGEGGPVGRRQLLPGRIQPYRTLENVIDGVVMTFTDITARATAEGAVQEARVLAESIVDTVREPLVVLDGRMVITSASRSFYRYFQVTPEETLGHRIFELGDRQWTSRPSASSWRPC